MTKEEKDKKYSKQMDLLAKKIEPYWDNKTRNIKNNAPDDIKQAYKELRKIWDKMTTM